MVKQILSIHNLNVYCHSATHRSENSRILYNIDLNVNEKDIIGLVGETGAGKSVLINTVGRNIQQPLRFEAEEFNFSNGQIDNTYDLLKLDDSDLRKIWGKGIAFIPPNARDKLNPILTIGEQFNNIITANDKITKLEAYKIVIEMFKKVQMPDPENNYNSYPHELSGGMAQRVVISIAFFLSPKLLLADEPTMGLDVIIQRQVLDLMAQLFLKKQKSVILATRDLGIIANYCNKVIVMCNGKIVEFDLVKDFFKNAKHPYSHYLLEAAFASHGMRSNVDSSKVATKKDINIRNNKICPFIGRCMYAKDMKELCFSTEPPVRVINKDHHFRCHKI